MTAIDTSMPAAAPAATDPGAPAAAPASAPAAASGSTPPSATVVVAGDADPTAAALDDRLAGSLEALADDGPAWHRAMQHVFGDHFDRGALESLRHRVLAGELELPAVRLVSDEAGATASIAGRELRVPAAFAGAPGAVARAGGQLAPVLAEAAGLPPEAGLAADARLLGSALDPTRNVQLDAYLQQPPANEATVPRLLQGLGAYESLPLGRAAISLEQIEDDWVAARIGTPPVVAELDDMGLANALAPEWRARVAEAARMNGGLGDSENGFLAFSREYGFVRLRNPRLTPEQNRRFAEMSLTLGVPVETLPSRTHDSALLDPNIDHWANEIIGRYDTELAGFLADPEHDSLRVNDGRKRSVLEWNADAGRFVSYDYRRSGGFRGFAQRNVEKLGPALDIATLALNVIPVFGQVGSALAAAAVQGLRQGMTTAVTGDFTAGQAVAIVGAGLPAAGPMSAANRALVQGGLGVGADLVDGRDVDPARIVATLAPTVLTGLPGGPAADRLAQQAAHVVTGAIADGRLDAGDALRLADGLAGLAIGTGRVDAPLAGMGRDAGRLRDVIAAGLGLTGADLDLPWRLGLAAASAVQRGELAAADVARVLAGVVERSGLDADARTAVHEATRIVADAVDRDHVDARVVVDWVLEQIGPLAGWRRRPPA